MNDRTHSGSSAETVRVWDPIVRLVHWGLVLGVAVAWFSAEESEFVHEWAGDVVAGLVALRLLWGFVGPREARFASFARGPAAVLDYLKGLASGTSRRHLGHNPAGGAMAIALLVALLGTTGSRMALLAQEEGGGPLAPWFAPAQEATATGGGQARHEAHREHDDEDEQEGGEEFLEEIHELFANATLALALLHVLGVAASSLAHRENLVRGMVTGRKRPLADG